MSKKRVINIDVDHIDGKSTWSSSKFDLLFLQVSRKDKSEIEVHCHLDTSFFPFLASVLHAHLECEQKKIDDAHNALKGANK